MFNLCLPMKVINISQHSGGSYSHPNGALDLCGSDTGIDFAYALGYWKCVAFPWGSNTAFFVSCDKDGNDARVHCADGVNRVVTIAMTHAKFLYSHAPVVGKVYSNGEVMYEEGTYSADPSVRITGNHIHFEVAQGKQTSKYKDSNMGVYRMKSELKPEDVCFICDSFSTVANMGGVVMKHCDTEIYDGPRSVIPDGYSEVIYDGQRLKMYKQSKNEKIALVSCEYGAICDICDVSLPGKKIKAVVNASYFEMGGNNGYLGRVQGFLNGTDKYVDARPSSPAEKGSKDDKPFMDLVLLKNGNLTYGDMNSWDYPVNEVTFGVSPAGIEIWEGASVNKYSPAVGYSKITTPNTQTMLMRTTDGSFVIGVVDGKMAPVPTLRTWGLTVGLNHLSIYDSGGSSQLLVNGIKRLYTGRKCPVWFVIYEEEESHDIPVFPSVPAGEIVCEGFPMHIRDKVVNGKVLTTIPKGGSCELLGLLDGIQSDGYQWAIARRGDVTGVCQYDSHVYWIKLNEKEK